MLYCILSAHHSGTMATGGAITALNATDDQNKFLDEVPEVNLFKFTFQRPEKFVIEVVEFPFQGAMQFGRRNTCELNQEAEVMGTTLLKCEFGVLRDGEMYTPEVGNAAIESIQMEFGGVEPPEIFDSNWLHLFNETHLLKDRKEKYFIGMHDTDAELIEWSRTGQVANPDYCEPLYVPFPAFWHRHRTSPLPVLALTGTLPKLVVNMRKHEDIVFGSHEDDEGVLHVDKSGEAKSQSPARLHMSVVVQRVVFLQATRESWAESMHRYLYDYIQIKSYSVDSIRPEEEMVFSNAVKEYMFLFQSNQMRMGKKYFVYQAEKEIGDALYLVPPLIDHQLLYIGNQTYDKQDAWWWHDYMFNEHHSNTPKMTRKLLVPHKVVDGKKVIDWNSPDMDLCQLQMNTQAVYCNCFAKAPEEPRPTGQVTWSAIPDITVKNTIEKMDDATMMFFVKAWNVVTIQRGSWQMVFTSGASK